MPATAVANAFFGGVVSVSQVGKFGHRIVSVGLGTLAGPSINALVSSPAAESSPKLWLAVVSRQ